MYPRTKNLSLCQSQKMDRRSPDSDRSIRSPAIYTSIYELWRSTTWLTQPIGLFLAELQRIPVPGNTHSSNDIQVDQYNFMHCMLMMSAELVTPEQSGDIYTKEDKMGDQKEEKLPNLWS
ncbi:hypothetical protein KQX54_015267 [Cotesia glomerata]|uniref:Uncharacterized protein n=1 Tax=Cotesia glomerata TaxID=32391 RepID=A0AAV7IW20_COTGL|nr:hypothetical protein KQX54_015267 [Cotesia glomerata]